MPWYKTGTAAFTNGSTAVVGTGTDWIGGASVGEAIIAPDGRIYEIATVASATTLTITPAYLGTNVTGAAYTIAPTQAYIRDLAAEVAELVNQYATVANGTGQGKFPDGTVTAPGIRFTADENTGLRRLSSDTMALVAGGVDIVTISPSGISAASLTTALNAKANLSGAIFTGEVKAPALQAQGTGPYLQAYDTDGPTDKKYWRWSLNAGVYKLENINDVYSAVVMTPVSFDASGNATFTGKLNAIGPESFQFELGSSDANKRAQFNYDASANLFSIGVENGYNITPMAFRVAGAERLRLGSDGNASFRNSIGFGYGAGSGGTVTQATSKSTAVTLNKPSGQITMHNAALAAGASVTFDLNNSLLEWRDGVLITPHSFGWNYRVEVSSVGAGAVAIRVTNITGGSLSDALILNFGILKGSTT